VTAKVCLHGKFRPLLSPFNGVDYVLTLSCGHLYGWRLDRDGEFPAEVDCKTCDAPPIDWLALLA